MITGSGEDRGSSGCALRCSGTLPYALIVTGALSLAAFCGCSKKESAPSVQTDQMTDQQKTEIAAQVLRGERPKSDLEKYGITLGERQEISVEDFRRQLDKERAATQPSAK